MTGLKHETWNDLVYQTGKRPEADVVACAQTNRPGPDGCVCAEAALSSRCWAASQAMPGRTLPSDLWNCWSRQGREGLDADAVEEAELLMEL